MDGFYQEHKQASEIRDIDRFLSKRLAGIRNIKVYRPT